MADVIFWVYRDNDLLIRLAGAVTIIFGLLVPVLFNVANNLDSRHRSRQALSLTDQSGHPNHAGTVRLFAKISTAVFLTALMFWPVYAVRDYLAAREIATVFSQVEGIEVSARGTATTGKGNEWTCHMYATAIEDEYLMCSRAGFVEKEILSCRISICSWFICRQGRSSTPTDSVSPVDAA